MPVDALEVSPLVTVRMLGYQASIAKVGCQIFPGHVNIGVVSMKFNFEVKPLLWFCEVLRDQGC